MRNQYLKSWETLCVFVCLMGILNVRSARATCSCDPEDTVQFKLDGTAYMAGTATVQISYGNFVTNLTITAGTVVWDTTQTPPQWKATSHGCVNWAHEITVNPKLDEPVLIQYIFNGDPFNQETSPPYADFPTLLPNYTLAANPVTYYSRPSMPCLHVMAEIWPDLYDNQWVTDPIVLVAASTYSITSFRIKGVVEADDSSVGYCTGPQAGGGEPQPLKPDLNNAQDFQASDLGNAFCPSGSQMANFLTSGSQAGFALSPKLTTIIDTNSWSTNTAEGDAKGGSGNGYSVFDPIGRLRWEMSLGSQGKSFTLGHLVYQADNLLDQTQAGSAYSTARLSLADGSDPQQVILDLNNNLRQVRLQNGFGLVDIISISDGFEIDIYPESQVGPISGGLYTFTAPPSLKWKVENPNYPSISGNVNFTRVDNSGQQVHTANWAQSTSTMTITRFNNQWKEVTVYTTSASPKERIETVSKYKGTTLLQHKTKTTYLEIDTVQPQRNGPITGWSQTVGDAFEAVTNRVEDPDGQALTTTYSWEANRPLMYDEKDPDGYHEQMTRANDDGPLVTADMIQNDYRPFGDTDLAWRKEPLPVYVYHNPEIVYWTNEVYYWANGMFPEIGYEVIQETLSDGGIWQTVTSKFTDHSKTAYAQEITLRDIGTLRLRGSVDDRGHTQTILYTSGFWNISSGTFDQSSGDVHALQVTTIYGGDNTAEQYGIPNETTIDVTVEDQYGHVFLEQSYINTDGTGNAYPANLITQTLHTYEFNTEGSQKVADGRELSRTRDGRLVYTATYNSDGTLASETDESGLKTTYDAYDGLLRVTQKTIHGRPGTGDADQVITYDYDVLGNATSETRTAGGLSMSKQWLYNYAGELESMTGPDGLTTLFTNDYSTGRKIVTETLPTQATKVSTYFHDRTLMSLTGTAVESEYDSELISPLGSGQTEARQVFRDNAQTELKSLQVFNWLGDEVTNQTLQFQSAGVRNRVTYYDNDGTGYTRRLATNITETGRTTQFIAYDDLGRVITNGFDFNNNGVLDASSTDPITTYSQQFVLSGTTWSNVSTVHQYKQDNSSTETLVQQTSTVVPWALQALDPSLVSQTMTALAGGGTTVTTETLDSSGNYTTTINDQEHGQTSTRVQRDRLVRSETMPGITSRMYSYTALGEVATVSDPVTGTLTYTYDPTTRQLTSTTESSGLLSHETDYIYYPAGGPNAGKLKGKKDPNANWTYFDYSTEGQIFRQWGVNTYPVQYQYDPAGHMTQMTTYRTTLGTGWASPTWPNPSGGDTTQWIYDTPSQLLQQKVYPDGGAGQKTVSYTYNSGNFMLTEVNGRLQTITYGFDTLGRLNTLAYSDGTPSAILGYDRAGRQVSVMDASGTHGVTWTDRDQMENETYTVGLLNGVTVSRAYDSAFRLQQLQFEQSGAVETFEKFAYTPISWLDHVSEMSTDGSSELRRYQYAYATGLPFVQSVAFSKSGTAVMTQNYTDDGLGRLQAGNVSLARGSTPYGVTYQFDNLDRRSEADLADGTKWSYGYNNRSEVTSGAKMVSSTVYAGGKQYAYTYDDIGNRLTAPFGGDATGANLRQSTYATANALNELTSRTVPGSLWLTGDNSPNAFASMLGAANGQAFTVQRQVNNQQWFGEATADNSSAPVYLRATVFGNTQDAKDFHTGHKFLAQSPENFTYDDDGNLKSDGQWNYTWDAENRLIQVVSATGVGPQQEIQFGYDYMGRRISKTVWNNTTGNGPPVLSELFVYDGWNLVATLNSPSTILQTFMWGPDSSGTMQGAGGVAGLLSMTIPSGSQAGTYFYGYDGNGNVMELVKTDQSIQATYEYGPFGEVIGAFGPLAQVNPFCFSTKYQDQETGLLYYGYRYYDPSIGKWLSRDPISEDGGINLYSTLGNDLVNRVDALGLEDPPSLNAFPGENIPDMNFNPGCNDSSTEREADVNMRAGINILDHHPGESWYYFDDQAVVKWTHKCEKLADGTTKAHIIFDPSSVHWKNGGNFSGPGGEFSIGGLVKAQLQAVREVDVGPTIDMAASSCPNGGKGAIEEVKIKLISIFGKGQLTVGYPTPGGGDSKGKKATGPAASLPPGIQLKPGQIDLPSNWVIETLDFTIRATCCCCDQSKK